MRSARNNSGLAGQSSGIKTLKGGKANIGDPVENIMRNFIHLIDAAQKNRAADMILQDMAKAVLPASSRRKRSHGLRNGRVMN